MDVNKVRVFVIEPTPGKFRVSIGTSLESSFNGPMPPLWKAFLKDKKVKTFTLAQYYNNILEKGEL